MVLFDALYCDFNCVARLNRILCMYGFLWRATIGSGCFMAILLFIIVTYNLFGLS